MSNFSCHRPYYGRDNFSKYFRYIIGFCGKVMPVNVIIDKGEHIPYVDFDEFTNVVEKDKELNTILLDTILSDYRIFNNTKMFGMSKKSDKVWHSLYDNSKNVYDIFIDLNTPLFLIPCGFSYNTGSSNRQLIVNPVLKDINFQRIKDPFTAFQEIERFITNDLVKETPIPEFDDSIKRDYHGFGDMSFKNRGKR